MSETLKRLPVKIKEILFEFEALIKPSDDPQTVLMGTWVEVEKLKALLEHVRLREDLLRCLDEALGDEIKDHRLTKKRKISSFKKGLRDGQQVKVKPIVLSEYTGIADCPNCYNRLGSEDSFCWNCGAEVERSG